MGNLYECINAVSIEKKPVREYYDQLQEYRNEPPDECRNVSERNILNGLVNSIRHTSFDYKDGLKRIRRIGKKEKKINYILYKNSILDKISKEYPFLEEACIKQKRPMDLIVKRKGNHK